MKTKHWILLVLLVQGVAIANATIVQKLLLKNGSQLEGYISTQRPGENFTFTAERAVVYMEGSDVKSITDQEIGIKQLSSKWIEWADKNDAFVGLGENRTLTLSDIVTKDRVISKVRVIERGAKVKYLEMSDNAYSLNWDTISVLRVDRRAKTALTGINRVYILENGEEYEGQYVEEVPGKTLSLYRDNGVVEVFETSRVVKYAMRKVNPNQDLFEQSQLLDIVALKNKTLIKGIIIEQNFTNKVPTDNYLLIQLENGTVQSVNLVDIEEYRKEVNPKYKALFDILLKEGELVINRSQTNTLNVTEQGSLIIVPEDTCFVEIDKNHPESRIIVETHFVEKLNNPTLDVVKVKTYADKKKKKKFQGFSYEDIVKRSIKPDKVETSVNKTTKFDFPMLEQGLYVIYNSEKKTVIPFKVK